MLPYIVTLQTGLTSVFRTRTLVIIQSGPAFWTYSIGPAMLGLDAINGLQHLLVIYSIYELAAVSSSRDLHLLLSAGASARMTVL